MNPFRHILDMVHHNPGEARFLSQYESPQVLAGMGFNGKVYFLFDSPTLAINWESVDPDIFPVGSQGRAWVDTRAAEIRKKFADCKAAGIAAYAMADLMLFPKSLVEKYAMSETFGDPRDPQTEKFLRLMIGQIFEEFPDFDGLVVRIGETYLEDAPHHQGSIRNKTSAEETIIPLMRLLREELCVKRGKTLVFRTWLSFDTDLETYLKVSDAVEPHPGLVIGVKHCEGDFHRANPFSKVIGEGRHPQLIEIQCAREYEGKGAYPNYIARGVIEGFEEHADLPAGKLHSLREFAEKHPEMMAGIWTWSRGGGWGGPFITNELWCDLNAWVIAQWANNPSESEESIFSRYALDRLKLAPDQVAAFRRLCLLSTDAVIRGRNSTHRDMNPWWTRDAGITWPEAIPDSHACVRNLEQKAEAIGKWEEIVSLAEAIQWPDLQIQSHVVGSAHYGLRLYRIYQAVVQLCDAAHRKEPDQLGNWLGRYDLAWADYNRLPEEYPGLSTLYSQTYDRWFAWMGMKNAHLCVEALRAGDFSMAGSDPVPEATHAHA